MQFISYLKPNLTYGIHSGWPVIANEGSIYFLDQVPKKIVHFLTDTSPSDGGGPGSFDCCKLQCIASCSNKSQFDQVFWLQTGSN